MEKQTLCAVLLFFVLCTVYFNRLSALRQQLTSEYRSIKQMDGNNNSLIWLLFQLVPGGTDTKHEENFGIGCIRGLKYESQPLTAVVGVLRYSITRYIYWAVGISMALIQIPAILWLWMELLRMILAYIVNGKTNNILSEKTKLLKLQPCC